MQKVSHWLDNSSAVALSRENGASCSYRNSVKGNRQDSPLLVENRWFTAGKKHELAFADHRAANVIVIQTAPCRVLMREKSKVWRQRRVVVVVVVVVVIAVIVVVIIVVVGFWFSVSATEVDVGPWLTEIHAALLLDARRRWWRWRH